MRESILLVGNGLNRLNNAHSWLRLIENLNREFANGKVNIDKKPFPLLFEEIVSKAVGNGFTEKEVLESIGKAAIKISHNDHHLRFLNAFSVIFTTNYDCALEKGCQHQRQNNPKQKIPKSETRETRYSLYRKIKIDQKEIWHIHGEAEHPNTICLGYDHYSGYLQNIRQYLTTGNKREIKHSIATRIRSMELNPVSWIEHMFISDIHIVGLDLSFVESELWWLFVYRQRLKQQKKLPIDNSIFYYTKVPNRNETKNKIELLSALGITVLNISSRTYATFYDDVLEKARSSGSVL